MHICENETCPWCVLFFRCVRLELKTIVQNLPKRKIVEVTDVTNVKKRDTRIGMDLFAVHTYRTRQTRLNTLQWRHTECDDFSKHRRLDCVLNLLSGTDQSKHQSPASLAFVRGIHRWPVDSRHKGPITGKMFAFNDVIMTYCVYVSKLPAMVYELR